MEARAREGSLRRGFEERRSVRVWAEAGEDRKEEERRWRSWVGLGFRRSRLERMSEGICLGLWFLNRRRRPKAARRGDAIGGEKTEETLPVFGESVLAPPHNYAYFGNF